MRIEKVKLALGTVQWGEKYGLTNNTGVPCLSEIKKILKISQKNNICLIDTSQNYGNVENILGNIVGSKIPIITKININANDFCEEKIDAYILKLLEYSKKRLRLKILHGVLIHNTNFIKSKFAHKYIKILSKYKNHGFVNKIGFSIYETEELKKICDLCDPDIIQIPLNIFNQSFLENKDLDKLKKNDCEIHVRSIFLQGLLMLKSNEIPKYFSSYKEIFDKWNLFCSNNNVKPITACFDFIKKSNIADVIIIGVNSEMQLVENIRAFQKDLNLNYSNFGVIDKNFIDPRNWIN